MKGRPITRCEVDLLRTVKIETVRFWLEIEKSEKIWRRQSLSPSACLKFYLIRIKIMINKLIIL